jgi:hypothetical protein
VKARMKGRTKRMRMKHPRTGVDSHLRRVYQFEFEAGRESALLFFHAVGGRG